MVSPKSLAPYHRNTQPMDHAEPYLRFILGFIGLTDIATYRIEGMSMAGVMETAVEKGLASVTV